MPFKLLELAEEKRFVRDYDLTGVNAEKAQVEGLASAQWYTSPVSKEDMEALLQRDNAPAIRDTVIWFSLLIGSGIAGAMLWGSLWAVIPFLIYGVVYASSSDSRWHESSHGTAFKTDWMNNVLYEIASFMVFRESTPWRWSHARHHSDTIILGRDPEIPIQRPVNLLGIFKSFFAIDQTLGTIKTATLHSFGKMRESEKSYIPEEEHASVYFKARVFLGIHIAVIAFAIAIESWLPVMYIGLPTFYGSWMMLVYGYTQHAGLAENVLDHRLNSRTVRMNLINRYLYWNMGYHIEHHMFPLVPYHQLPKLHALVEDDMPKPYKSLWEAWKEIIPTLFMLSDQPELYVERELPEPKRQIEKEEIDSEEIKLGELNEEGWFRLDGTLPKPGQAVRFDHSNDTYALYANDEGELYVSDGFCTHGKSHLSDGVVIGDQIECAKHNGRFNLKDGSCARRPVCVNLKMHEVKRDDDGVYVKLNPLEVQKA